MTKSTKKPYLALERYGDIKTCPECGNEFTTDSSGPKVVCSRACAARRNTGPRKGRPITPWQERFWRYVTAGAADDCWEWRGSRDQHGYGRLQRGGRTGGHIKAHRASFLLHGGNLQDGEVLRHRCDNPPCVNPAHLEPGTMADNTRDMYDRGREARRTGADNARTKHPDSAIRELRERAAAGEQIAGLARAFGLRENYAWAIVLGQRRAAAGGPIREMKS